MFPLTACMGRFSCSCYKAQLLSHGLLAASIDIGCICCLSCLEAQHTVCRSHCFGCLEGRRETLGVRSHWPAALLQASPPARRANPATARRLVPGTNPVKLLRLKQDQHTHPLVRLLQERCACHARRCCLGGAIRHPCAASGASGARWSAFSPRPLPFRGHQQTEHRAFKTDDATTGLPAVFAESPNPIRSVLRFSSDGALVRHSARKRCSRRRRHCLRFPIRCCFPAATTTNPVLASLLLCFCEACSDVLLQFVPLPVCVFALDSSILLIGDPSSGVVPGPCPSNCP